METEHVGQLIRTYLRDTWEALVKLPVCGEQTALSEARSTRLTLQWFSASMNMQVLYEVLLRSQDLAAVRARKLATLQVYAVYVTSHIELRRKGL